MQTGRASGGFNKTDINILNVIRNTHNVLEQLLNKNKICLFTQENKSRVFKQDIIRYGEFGFHSGYKTILHHYLSYYLGAGICVYNDGIFSDADWQGVRRLSESVKRSDPTTVGRFGLGFKSVFHITDYVTILSGEKVLFMNPCEPESRMCRIIQLSKLHQHLPKDVCLQVWGKFINQNQLEQGNFSGTIFWFPLRASPSKLSGTVYTHKHVQNLFDSFATEGSMSLIFLRSLEKISLQMITSHKEKSQVPYLVVEMQSSSMLDIRRKRQEFCSQLDSYIRSESPCDKVICCYNITIRTLLNGAESKQQYTILHYLSSKVQSLLTNSDQQDNSQLPLVGIAAPLDNQNKTGQLFCFLPLPLDQENNTALPVFINGYFVLNQNRRHVLWKSADTMNDKDVEWNEYLTEQVLPHAYLELIEQMRSEVAKGNVNVSVLYGVIPNVYNTNGRWQKLAKNIWKGLKTSPIIYSHVKKELLQISQVTVTNSLSVNEEVHKSVIKTLTDLNTPLAALPDRIWTSLHYLVGFIF
ncbi:unnamed protein product, partial [Meganyctiphanes norvegica]